MPPNHLRFFTKPGTPQSFVSQASQKYVYECEHARQPGSPYLSQPLHVFAKTALAPSPALRCARLACLPLTCIVARVLTVCNAAAGQRYTGRQEGQRHHHQQHTSLVTCMVQAACIANRSTHSMSSYMLLSFVGAPQTSSKGGQTD